MRVRQRLKAGLGATLMLLCAARPCSAFLSAPSLLVLGPRAAPSLTRTDGLDCRRRPADLALHAHGTDGHGQSSGSEDSFPRRAALSDLGRRALAFPVALCLAGSRAAPGAAVEVVEGVKKLDDVVAPLDAGGKSWLWKKLQDGDVVRMEGTLAAPDIFYPPWMLGLWQVSSATRSVEAPLGPELFGSPAAFEAATQDVGKALTYTARFRRSTQGRVVADRAYNVASISRAAMGDAAVLQCYEEEGNANKLTLTLVPGGAGGRVFNAELSVLARDQSGQGNDSPSLLFGCTESSRQMITANTDGNNGPPGGGPKERGSFAIPRAAPVSSKETQVIQVFCSDSPEPSSFRSVQRICTFLTQADFVAKLRSKQLKGPGLAELYEASKKVPADVRTYDITYTRVKKPAAPPAPA